MPVYAYKSMMRRTVNDLVHLEVDDINEADARAKAVRVLMSFPEPHFEEGVPFCHIETRNEGSSEILEIDNVHMEAGVSG
jgi:hypothetical protein